MAARRLKAAINDTRSTTVNQNRCRAKPIEEVKQRNTFAQEKMYYNADSERTKTGVFNLLFYSAVPSKHLHLPQMERPFVNRENRKIRRVLEIYFIYLFYFI